LPCFVRGTLIATPGGERLVEDLQIGDEVVTATGGVKRIIWVGSGRAAVQPWNPRSVIVRAGALADRIPKRDLRLTVGHSLFIDGLLVQVETLVNGRSIVWDTEAENIEYYHVEVEGHDVILAEGAPTETYRNDGNRRYFLAGVVGPSGLTEPNEVPVYAPIVADGLDHDRIWRKLSDRAGRPDTTREADIHLIVDGRRVVPDAVLGSRYLFSLGEAPREIRLSSATFCPFEIGIGRDERTLGVAVKGLLLRGKGVTTWIEHLCPLLADGWNGAEANFRWTGGDAVIPLLGLPSGAFTLEADIALTGEYPLTLKLKDSKIRMAAAE